MKIQTFYRTALFLAAVVLLQPHLARSEQPGQILHSDQNDNFRRHSVSEIFTGIPAPVDMKSDPQARQFRTRLAEGAKQGPNFAGRYTIVEWGCGTNCQQIAVLDARTGRVTDWLTTEMGSSYRLDSKLFIENPDIWECSQLDWCETKYYRLEAGKFNLLK